MIDIFSRITTKQWGAFFAVVSSALLAAVFISQYGFGLQPCKLCLWQRVPYAMTGLLGVTLFFLQDKKAARIFLLLIGALFLFNAGLALFHTGVEYKWWTFNSECTGSNVYKPDASVEDMLAALKAAPTVRCDERVEFLFGMTMAFYNMLTAFGLSVIAFTALMVQRSSSPSQYK